MVNEPAHEPIASLVLAPTLTIKGSLRGFAVDFYEESLTASSFWGTERDNIYYKDVEEIYIGRRNYLQLINKSRKFWVGIPLSWYGTKKTRGLVREITRRCPQARRDSYISSLLED